MTAVKSGLGPSRFARLASLASAWVLLAVTWGILGTRLNLNGPSHPTTGADIACAVIFVTSVVTAVPIGVALRRRRFTDLLWLAAIATAAEELSYVATMFASSDPTSDTTAVVGVLLSFAPLYGLLLGLLAAGMGGGRLLERWQRRPRLQPTTSP
jgi:hypothetical protein